MGSPAGTLRSKSRIRRLLVPAFLAAATVLFGYAPVVGRQKEFNSPDGKLVAVVAPAGKEKGFEP